MSKVKSGTVSSRNKLGPILSQTLFDLWKRDAEILMTTRRRIIIDIPFKVSFSTDRKKEEWKEDQTYLNSRACESPLSHLILKNRVAHLRSQDVQTDGMH
jgi:hypothetical protein